MRTSRSAFSLIEILATTAIISVLAALATAGVSSMMDSSKRTQSLALLRAIGHASQMYSNDNDGALPKSQHQSASWVGSLAPYLGLSTTPSVAELRKVYHSPGDPKPLRNWSYAINDFLTPAPYGAANVNFSRRQSIPQPSQTLHFAEVADGFEGSDHFHFASSGFSAASLNGQIATARYRNAGVYLFLDGHVETLEQDAAAARANQAGSTFIHPGGEASAASDY